MKIEPAYTPTPEQIKRACAQIRKGWGEAKTYRRTATYAGRQDKKVFKCRVVIGSGKGHEHNCEAILYQD